VDPAVMQEVAKMVAQSCSTCSKAMRAEGIKVHFPYQLVSARYMTSCTYSSAVMKALQHDLVQ